MTPALRLLDMDVAPARWNIAMTAAMRGLHRVGATPDTLRFYCYQRSVLLGRHQGVAAVDAGRCRDRGIEIARRVTGGGAVYMSPGILAWDLVARHGRFGNSLDDAARCVGSILSDGLNQFGLDSHFVAPNSIEAAGRKVSGMSGSFEGRTLVLQGTMLVDFDRIEMGVVLKALPNGGAPVARVTSIAELLGRRVPLDHVRATLIAACTAAWGGARGELHADELKLADALLADEIGSDVFVMGPTERAQAL